MTHNLTRRIEQAWGKRERVQLDMVPRLPLTMVDETRARLKVLAEWSDDEVRKWPELFAEYLHELHLEILEQTKELI